MPEDRQAWQAADRAWTKVLIEPIWRALTRSGRRRRDAEQRRKECPLRRRNSTNQL